MVAYDFETTPIAPGTPRPVWLTAYARDIIHLEAKVLDSAPRTIASRNGESLMVAGWQLSLNALLTDNFLTDENLDTAFVAWYGNGFDAYFIAAALVFDDRFILRPFLTKGNSLRGLRVIRSCDAAKKKPRGWMFLDGMAQLGLAGISLAKFLATFAPEHQKLTGVIDFEREHFDPKNPNHRAYAMRDSVGLWHAMTNAQDILMRLFDEPLRVTMGGACIRIFQAHIPEETTIPTPRDEVLDIIRLWVMRGGFCYCVKRYKGPVWKYDINQAYAAAMREASLPSGFTTYTEGAPPKGKVFIARVTASKPANKVPFYYRTADARGRMRSDFAMTEIRDTWLTGIEVEQLKRERWKLTIHESWFWEERFSMREYVDLLEHGRMNCEGGPSGAIGTMYKAVGNHSYGKTVEQIEPLELVMAAECPDGFLPYHVDAEADPLPFVWFRWIEDEPEKNYHQPQLGAFITAHVRMVVRRAALLDPDAWLYADTDCVVFSRDVTKKLKIDAKRYGFWKIEEEGAHYEVIAKKVYAQIDGPEERRKRSAKGMRVSAAVKTLNRASGEYEVRKLTPKDFDDWFNGEPPKQEQVQRQNILVVMQGGDMYRAQERTGTRVEATR